MDSPASGWVAGSIQTTETTPEDFVPDHTLTDRAFSGCY
jgi:hypothetical protein